MFTDVSIGFFYQHMFFDKYRNTNNQTNILKIVAYIKTFNTTRSYTV